MRKIYLLLLIAPLHLFAQPFTGKEIARWEEQAKQVTIVRDNWGVPHIYGKSDADAVFGLMYAQCEDDFKRVEMNYIEKLGRLAEVKGENELYNDLLIRMLIDSTAAKADYKNTPKWLKQLLIAHADGINYYIHKHPEVKPLLLKRFHPWYSLLWTDGSIGAISTADIRVNELKSLYSESEASGSLNNSHREESLTGSNGFAIAPSLTEAGNAILYINPHVTFYFRPEVHMVSEEGLNAYGAVTWGQFFVYQGFNEHCGWMHTSSDADVADSYIEKLSNKNDKWVYEYNGSQKAATQRDITIRYRSGDLMESKTVKALFTHHGPVMAKRNGQYLSLKSNNRSMVSLIQSWQRTKATSFAAFKETMNLVANTSNNTVYADAEGNIAYWHGNFLPVRDTTYNWSEPVDGSKPATEWKGLHKVEESVHSYNPPNGWLQNCNSTPFTAAGINSPKRKNFPSYMAPRGENFRGINAVRVLQRQRSYTIDKVIAAGYDTYLTAFEIMIPALISAFENKNTASDSPYAQLKDPVAILKDWDFHSSKESIATTLAIEWAQRLTDDISVTKVPDKQSADIVDKTKAFVANAPAMTLLQPLSEAVGALRNKYGDWRIAWGEINRFQRISGDIENTFSDSQESLPVPFVSSQWGMLPSYVSRYFGDSKKRYGTGGNSFICAVEFGKKIKAKSLLAGGQSGVSTSGHFKDQAEMYTKGEFKDVLFYKEDVVKHAERTYHPGEF